MSTSHVYDELRRYRATPQRFQKYQSEYKNVLQVYRSDKKSLKHGLENVFMMYSLIYTLIYINLVNTEYGLQL